ncbi:uncharacterized protein M421DRAFT_422850 [Didymella exigua CBS 183.55]|uniref:Cryptic loci regulator 2 N-terminal domain-containing protein n=1 Tax=Didymella exigua CBS 183.55 TaxID=1150837 RepID=A0A6A5RGG9_9PLEO|nr:uncharacterized protein M421DRAFT_422850 [Didymella exigua CBS 183.55]KAF1926174.1 hypothetical protein M421DRAFT_422850 [Didymella exigua CBS 183.55]
MSSPRRIVVQLRPGTDGDATHTPKAGVYEQLDPPTLYLEKIGDQWMQARGEAQPGVKYTLESLPAGYTLWQRPRSKDPKHLDKYLYGHPGKKAFDSPNRFFPHFQHLMDNGDSMGCPCTLCSGSSGVLPSTKARSSSVATSNASSRPSSSQSSARAFPAPAQAHLQHPTQPEPTFPAFRPVAQPPTTFMPAPSMQYKGRPKLVSTGMDTTRVDEEGSPDVYRNLINKLRRHERVDEAIEEPFSMDWRTEQELLPELRRKVNENPQWVPRAGDIVLYVRDLPDDVHILRYPVIGDYRMYDEKEKQWLDQPVWEAGLVSQTPAEEVTINDVCENGQKERNVTYSGVRVEPLPDVNSTDKSLSKRHKYIPVRHTRPFILWKHFLHHHKKLHPTILNAQTITATMSLTGKYRFTGVWPEASIYCRAMYLGYEMLAVGDAVRLLPNASRGQTTSTDILIIKSIRLKWSNLDSASENDWDEGRPYNSAVWIYGAAYTSDPSRQNKEWFSDSQSSQAADDYGDWYPLHPPSKELAIPYSRVIGRLYERNAMALWLNIKSGDCDFLDAGREALVESRDFARQHDIRISSRPDAKWHWADSRAQALDLHTVNGLDVSSHDQLRDPTEWRKKIKIMEGLTTTKVVPIAKPTSAPGLTSRSMRGFMAPTLSDLPVRSQLSRISNTTSASSRATGSSTGGSAAIRRSRKRTSRIVVLSSDEENEEDDAINEEIRQGTRIIDDAPGVQPKKARVQVAIGLKQQR